MQLVSYAFEESFGRICVVLMNVSFKSLLQTGTGFKPIKFVSG